MKWRPVPQSDFTTTAQRKKIETYPRCLEEHMATAELKIG
jgi:hypothetical protein